MRGKRSSTKAKGRKGEDIACLFLVKRGFTVLERNYWKPWGEIDVIAERDNLLHFVEVKAVTVSGSEVNDRHRPEENLHRRKLQRLYRTIVTYLAEKKVPEKTLWQIDGILVELKETEATVRALWNIQ
jgi:putative endonuclease